MIAKPAKTLIVSFNNNNTPLVESNPGKHPALNELSNRDVLIEQRCTYG